MRKFQLVVLAMLVLVNSLHFSHSHDALHHVKWFECWFQATSYGANCLV